MGTHDIQLPLERQSGFPWRSVASLLYPTGAMIYAACLGAPFIVAVGYGIANLAYLLFAAWVFVGTFSAFHLTKRWQVFSAAAIAFGLGTLLSNVE